MKPPKNYPLPPPWLPMTPIFYCEFLFFYKQARIIERELRRAYLETRSYYWFSYWLHHLWLHIWLNHLWLHIWWHHWWLHIWSHHLWLHIWSYHLWLHIWLHHLWLHIWLHYLWLQIRLRDRIYDYIICDCNSNWIIC